MYIINIAENVPAGKGMMQTRHYAELRLATTSVVEATNIMHTLHATWPIEHKIKGCSFVFKLISVEERDLQSLAK